MCKKLGRGLRSVQTHVGCRGFCLAGEKDMDMRFYT